MNEVFTEFAGIEKHDLKVKTIICSVCGCVIHEKEIINPDNDNKLCEHLKEIGDMQVSFVNDPGPTFFAVSMVSADIKSQWQAHFLQVFPIKMEELPKTHESDKEVFEKCWRGDKSVSYEQFMKDNYGLY